MKNKKILIVVIIVILALAIVSAVMGYLFFETDTFKSDKELFGKYVSQNFETITNLKNSETYSTYQNLKNEGTYESKQNFSLKYSEGGEISNPLNDLEVNITTQKDNINEYIYKDAQILYQDEEYLEAEVIRDEELYGIRFLDVIRQFISIKENEDLDKAAERLGVDVSDLENYMALIWETKSPMEELIIKEEYNSLKEKYINIIKNNFAKATYSKLKKTMITVNNATLQTNAYTATFSGEQTRSMVLDILNNINSDEIIINKIKKLNMNEKFSEYMDKLIEDITDVAEFYTLKVVVYENNGITVKTILETNKNKISIDNSNINGQVTMNIQSNIVNDEKEENQTIQITKANSENQETYNIAIETVNGDETTNIDISNKMQKSNNNITTDTEIEFTQGIESIGLIIKNNTDIVDEITDKVELDNTTNVLLNDLEQETIDLLQERIPEKIKTRLNLLSKVLDLNTTPQEPGITEEESQLEINKFKAKFEFYTGEEVSTENVKKLLEVVKDNINSAQIETIEEPDENVREEDIRIKVKIKIEQGVSNEELVNEIEGKLKEKAKYDVSIEYKDNDTNKMIDSITITEREK